MHAVRVVLIGGTSNTGKSTVAGAVAGRLGFECLSTDSLARHPGRPWRRPGWEVPAHVAGHYGSLTVGELITSVLDHYERLWPRVEEIITSRAAGGSGPGLVLEGSALWPAWVAQLTVPRTAAVWLTADEALLQARIHAAGRYSDATDAERQLMDKFLGRTRQYQALMLDDVGRLGLHRIDVTGRSVEDLASDVLAAVATAGSQRRSTHPAEPVHQHTAGDHRSDESSG